MTPYRSYADYLRNRYGRPARRVSVDAGLGCPHAGCLYCAAGSAAPGTEAAGGDSLAARVDAAVGRASRDRDPVLLLYLQSYTGTNAPPLRLRGIYDAAVARADFRELIVSTRPDCVDAARADLLASYRRPDFDVWVELGLQSWHGRTLDLLGRGHDLDCFLRAFALLRERGVRVGVHLIAGLPGESGDDFLESARQVGRLRPDGIKLHNLHVCRGTPLERLYLRGEVTVPCFDAHLRAVAEALELQPAEAVVLRLTTDTPREQLLAPSCFGTKDRFVRALRELMVREGRRQGGRFAG